MQVIPVTAVRRGFGVTSRRDAWWAAPLAVFLGLSAFVVYATWAAFQGSGLALDTMQMNGHDAYEELLGDARTAPYGLGWGLLFLALTVPWHWLAEVRNEGFLGFFFVGEQFLRFLGRREPPVLWSVPLGTFLGLIPVWFFPWTVFLPAAFSGDRRTRGGNTAVLLRLALVWIVVVVGFFSLSDRLEHYVFPALPAFALLAAAAFYRKGESRALLWGFRALAAVGVLALLGGILLMYVSPAKHWWESSRTASATSEELRTLEAENAELRERAQRLADPDTLELEARRLGMTRSDERAFSIVEP